MIKVDLVTGFLGAGKTTFIKEYAAKLVERGERVAIIVNDYGAINVDRLLLEETLGEMCHLEMVIGGDADCTRRRLKTKLIAVGMDRYTRVIVEPSGVFEVDDFFDMLYEEPLERWYEIGSVITLVEAGIERDLSEEGRYLLASQISKAGIVVLSKLGKDISEQKQIYVNQMLDYINDSLLLYKCTRSVKDLYVWERNHITKEDIEHIQSAGYRSGEMVKLPVSEEGGFSSLFFFHLKTDIDQIEDRIKSIFMDEQCGNVIRIKGFIQNTAGKWFEINATRRNNNMSQITIGQDLFIVIGERLDRDRIERLLTC